MQQRSSVYNVGAVDGLIMGAYLTLMFLLQSLGLGHTVLLLLGDAMMLGLPVLTYIQLRRGYLVSHRFSSFSAIWLHGIIIFLCGSLIMAVFVYVFLRYLDPSFIYHQIKVMAEVYDELGTEQAHEMSVAFQRLIDNHMLPTPMSVAFSLVWLVSFLGSVLSCILAFIVRWRHKRANS